MNALINLAIICLILIVTFIHPINSNIFQIDLSPERHAQNEQNELNTDNPLFKILTLSNEAYYINPKNIKFKIVDLNETGNSINDQSISEHISCELEIYKIQANSNLHATDRVPISTLTLSPSIDHSNSSGDSTVIEIPIDKTMLKLDFGQYEIKLKLASGGSEVKSNFDILYIPNGISKHISQYPNHSMICYYFTRDKKYKIPIFAPVQNSKNEYRTMLETMKFNPQIAGISIEEQLPWAFNIWYSTGNLDIKFDKAALKSIPNNKINPLAIELLIENYSEIKGINIVNTINIHEYSDEQCITNHAVSRNPKIYMPIVINTKNEIMFSPFSITEFESLEQYGREFMDIMQNIKADSKMLTLLPKSVRLNHISMVGNTIKLDFNDELRKFFSNEMVTESMADIFINSIALSFTSINEVEEVEISINNAKVNKLGKFKFEKNITRPKFYN